MKKLYDNVIEHKYGYCFKKDGKMVRCATASHVPIIPPYGASSKEWEEYIKLQSREFVYVEDSIYPKNVAEESKAVFCNDHAEDFKNETLYKIAESLKVNKPYDIVVTVDKERDAKPMEGVKLTLSKISDMIKEEHDR